MTTNPDEPALNPPPSLEMKDFYAIAFTGHEWATISSTLAFIGATVPENKDSPERLKIAARISETLQADGPAIAAKALAAAALPEQGALTQWASPDDQPLEEDAEIDAAHPVNVSDPAVHEVYQEALRLVGARRSKYGLVNLVHWLLWKNKASALPAQFCEWTDDEGDVVPSCHSDTVVMRAAEVDEFDFCPWCGQKPKWSIVGKNNPAP